MHRGDHNQEAFELAFLDELSKIAQATAPRGLMSDFWGGVDPTGTKTFQYGMQDAQRGKPSGLRRAVGAAGGVVGGAAVIPAAVGGTVGALKGFAAGKGGIARRLLSAGREALSGATKPYTSLYHGVRGRGALAAHQAGKKLTQSQAGSLQKLVREASPLAAATKGKLTAAQTQAALRGFTPEQLASAQRTLSGELAGGAGALGLSGLISGGSAYMQYGKGAKTQQDVNRQLAARGVGR